MTGIVHDAHIRTVEDLDAQYGAVAPPSVIKEVDHVHPVYRPFVEAAPFIILETAGINGLDATPRGDPTGFFHIEDAKILILPDRCGNNQIDSLRNIVTDPRLALLFMVPGVGETLRVNGKAEILANLDHLARFAMARQLPKTILRITVNSVFFQCSRAVIRAGLWKQESTVARDSLPSVGVILRTLS